MFEILYKICEILVYKWVNRQSLNNPNNKKTIWKEIKNTNKINLDYFSILNGVNVLHKV